MITNCTTPRTAALFAYIANHVVGGSPIIPSYSKCFYARLTMRYLDSNFTINTKISHLPDHIGIDRSYRKGDQCRKNAQPDPVPMQQSCIIG